MSNERKLIDFINNTYSQLNLDLSDEQKMLFETGIAKGIIFALTELINTDIDLTVLGQYSPE